MTRLAAVLAALGVAVAIGCAVPAAAEPDDHVPYCSGDETPVNSNCRVAPSQISTHGGAPGANPGVPLGTGSGEALMPGQGN
jgi:hypothetical protein